MTPEQIAKHIEKDLDDSYIHVYPENEKVVCKVQGNGLILFTMIDQALSGISEKSGMSYDQALSTLKLIHKNRRCIDDVVINKILGIYNMNKIILAGRLTRDAEIRYTSGAEQTAIARMSIAVDRRYKKDGAPSADFFNLVAFGKLADFFGQYGWKGTKFIIEGRLQSGSYENRDGKKVYTVDVVVESAEFAESKKSSERNNDNSNPAPAAGDGEFLNVPDVADDELPFA